MREMEVVGVRVEVPANQPIVLLRDPSTGRLLPIWIGAAEASAIVMALEGVEPARPMTHDLFATTIAALGATLSEVRITELREDVFFAELRLDGETSVSARPSDAIAVALRLQAPILADEDVLARASLQPPEDDETVVEQFKEFLDHIEPEDFERGRGQAGPDEETA